MRIFAVGTKIFGGGAWPTFGRGGGAVPPGPNVEPPLSVGPFVSVKSVTT